MDWVIPTPRDTYVPSRYIKLYVDHSDGDGYLDSDADWNLFRYSHVLLMCAEALNEVNNGPTADAYTYINDSKREGRACEFKRSVTK